MGQPGRQAGLVIRNGATEEGETEMASPALNRLAGVAMTAGAWLSIIGYVTGSTGGQDGKLTPASVSGAAFVGGNVAIYLGSALMLLAIPAMMTAQYERSRKLTLLGGAGLILVTLIQGVSNTFGNFTLWRGSAGPSSRPLALR
jgi:hypothetical protein